MFYDDIQKLIDHGKLSVATNYLHQYEQLHPQDYEVALKLGEIYDQQDNWYESERYYRKAIKLNPKCIHAYTMLDQVLRQQGRYSECREILQAVLKMLPSIEGPVKTSMAMLDMCEKGSLAKGLREYENRFSFSHMEKAYKEEFFPRWTGKDSLQGLDVLMRFEQGLGDTLQFARYSKLLKDLGATKVDILCKKPLVRILQRTIGVDEVITDHAGRHYDKEVMMMSIPALTNRVTPSQIMRDASPYLSVSPEDAAMWLEKMKPTGKLKVGLVWAGDHKGGWQAERMNDRRSIKLEHFRTILDVDCDFYSLQKGKPESQLKDFYAAYPIKNIMGDVTDFYDTACIIANLDLVITVDTSTAHLAGGMGVRTWMLSRLEGDWRWLNGKKDTPWYPRMEIFKQRDHAEWRPLLNEVAERLRKLI